MTIWTALVSWRYEFDTRVSEFLCKAPASFRILNLRDLIVPKARQRIAWGVNPRNLCRSVAETEQYHNLRFELVFALPHRRVALPNQSTS